MASAAPQEAARGQRRRERVTPANILARTSMTRKARYEFSQTPANRAKARPPARRSPVPPLLRDRPRAPILVNASTPAGRVAPRLEQPVHPPPIRSSGQFPGEAEGVGKAPEAR